MMYSFDHYHHIFNQYLIEKDFSQAPRALYEPVQYILSLGGKRLRPLLVLMGHNLYDEDIEKALPAAFSVEIFHNFTLLHDDIMDAAPLRRGKPTVHAKYNINTGILSGDVMLIYAYDFLTRHYPPQLSAQLLTVFNKMAIEVCEGQQYDMDFENRKDVTIEAYTRMIELKTSVLLGAAIQMGALIGGAPLLDSQHLYEFGRNLGIAFQIQDDILDTFGDPQKFGKKVGGDIIQNKKTFLVLKSFEIGSAAQKTQLSEWMATPTTDEAGKIAAVRKLFEAVNVRAYAEEAQNNYLNDALRHLKHTPLSYEKKNYLKNWADWLMNREH